MKTTCKCGAETYEQHLTASKTAHTYKPKARSASYRPKGK